MFNNNELEETRRASEFPEGAEAATLEGLDDAEDCLLDGPEVLEIAGDSLEDTAALASIEDVIDALGLSPEEAKVYADIVSDIPVENASGYAKVYGDCISTTCTYTSTYYSCPSTGG